jgi:hypothetical protein
MDTLKELYPKVRDLLGERHKTLNKFAGVRTLDEEAWSGNLDLVRKHIEEKESGYALIDDPVLREWAHNQRRQYQLFLKDPNSCPLTDDRILRLQSIGFVWEVLQGQWQMCLDELKVYKEVHGDFIVSLTTNHALFRWTRIQHKSPSRYWVL